MNTENPYKLIQQIDIVRNVYFEAKKPGDIWQDVVENDQPSMQKLCDAMRDLVNSMGVPAWLVSLSAAILYRLVYKRHGHFIEESDYLSSTVKGISPAFLAFLQRQYTLSHMGCSVAMAWDEANQEMLCFRSLDWQGSNDIARSTRQFLFVNAQGEEVAKIAGITGMVGVLTGVKPGFSIAINFAPWKRSARFKSDPTFLIRQLLENPAVNDYHSAYEYLKTWDVGSPCFISLCGVKKGEAAIFEFGSKQQRHIREMGEEGYLVQTNHYDPETSPFTQHNEPPIPDGWDDDRLYHSELRPNSQYRRKLLSEALQSVNSDDFTEERLMQAYLRPPVINWETAQWVVMRPGSGAMDIYSCIDK